MVTFPSLKIMKTQNRWRGKHASSLKVKMIRQVGRHFLMVQESCCGRFCLLHSGCRKEDDDPGCRSLFILVAVKESMALPRGKVLPPSPPLPAPDFTLELLTILLF